MLQCCMTYRTGCCVCRYVHGLAIGWACGRHSWCTFLPGASVDLAEKRCVSHLCIFAEKMLFTSAEFWITTE